jgi:hypothetical protein
MAKSTTSKKKDPQDTQTSARRRRSDSAAQNGADETAPQPTRPRRKPVSRRESDADRTTGTLEPLAAGQRQASAEPTDRLTAEVEAPPTDVPHEHIAVRAYHRYLERGGRAGDDFEDWITAERELRERAAERRAR